MYHLFSPPNCSEQVIFNVLILVIVWPWVYFAYRRVLTTLRAKYRGQEVM